MPGETSNELAIKILNDLLKATNRNPQLNSFEIIETPATGQSNTSPVVVDGTSLGFHSWAVPIVLPFAYNKILSRARDMNFLTLRSSVLAVNFLHPEMATAWNFRRELVQKGKIPLDPELRFSQMALTASPKCNDVLAYRRWLLSNYFPVERFDNEDLLENELAMLNTLANRHKSNYHAWSHRKWCLSTRAAVPRDRPDRPPVKEYTKEQLAYLYHASNLSLYCKELERNIDFTVEHVSDHCAMQFRSFLLDQVFLILRNSEIDYDVRPPLWSQRLNAFYDFIVSVMLQQLERFFAVTRDTILHEYLDSMSHCLSVFTIKVALILSSLSKNEQLIHFYPMHEALWCFRRCLLHKLKECLDENQSVVAQIINNGVIHLEREFVKVCATYLTRPVDAKLLSNYCNFVKRTMKIDLNYQ